MLQGNYKSVTGVKRLYPGARIKVDEFTETASENIWKFQYTLQLLANLNGLSKIVLRA